jgi:hypothetical protein
MILGGKELIQPKTACKTSKGDLEELEEGIRQSTIKGRKKKK